MSIVILLSCNIVYGATITSAASGDWVADAATCWVGAAYPTDGDSAIIADTHQITVDANITVGTTGAKYSDAVVIQSGGTLYIDGASSYTLTLKGDLECNTGAFVMGGDPSNRNILHFTAGVGDAYYGLYVRDGGTCSLDGDGDYNNTDNYWRTKVDSAVTASDGTFEVADSTDWISGDVLAVSGESYNDAEEVVVDSVSGTEITIAGTFTDAHPVGCIVLNMTRNVVIKGDATPGYTTIISRTHTADAFTMSFVEISDCGSSADGIQCSVSDLLTMEDSTFRTGNGFGLYLTNAGRNMHFKRDNFWMDDGRQPIRVESLSNTTFTDCSTIQNTTDTNTYSSSCNLLLFDECWIYGGGGAGFYAGGGTGTDVLNCEIINNRYYCLDFLSAQQATATNCILQAATNVSRVTNMQFGASVLLDNCLFYENGWTRDAVIPGQGNGANNINWCQNYNQTIGDHRLHYAGNVNIAQNIASTETTIVHSAGNTAFEMAPFNTDPKVFEVSMDIPSSDGDVITMWGYYRKSTAASNWDQSPCITMVSDEGGISTSATISDVNDTWEYFSFGGTKTNDGYLRITFKSGLDTGGTGVAYFDDMRVMIGSAVYDVAQVWTKGTPTFNLSAISTTAEGLWKVDITAADYQITGMASDFVSNMVEYMLNEVVNSATFDIEDSLGRRLRSLGNPVTGVVDDGDTNGSSTLIYTNLSETTADHYNGWIIYFTDGDADNQARIVSDYYFDDDEDIELWAIVVEDAFIDTPADEDVFELVPVPYSYRREMIVDDNWDEPTVDHTGAGSTGQALIDAASTQTTADAVWDAQTSNHDDAGSTGESNQKQGLTIQQFFGVK